MTTKVKELDNTKEGNRNSCPVCNPRKDIVPAWRVWAWSMAHPGESYLRA